jgi:hypothetical protein
MKRSYEDRINFSNKIKNSKKHKPNRNEYGIYKTRRYYNEELKEKFIEEELTDLLL